MAGEMVERLEQRYIVEDSTTVARNLASSRFARATYRVRTLYLPAVGRSRLRLREYDGSGVWWLEHKLRRRDVVRKIRHRLGALELGDVQVAADVNYRRTAFARNGIRITIDDQLRHDGEEFAGIVIEVKGDRDTTSFDHLLPEPDPTFSKFEWAVGKYEGGGTSKVRA